MDKTFNLYPYLKKKTLPSFIQRAENNDPVMFNWRWNVLTSVVVDSNKTSYSIVWASPRESTIMTRKNPIYQLLEISRLGKRVNRQEFVATKHVKCRYLLRGTTALVGKRVLWAVYWMILRLYWSLFSRNLSWSMLQSVLANIISSKQRSNAGKTIYRNKKRWYYRRKDFSGSCFLGDFLCLWMKLYRRLSLKHCANQ